MFIRKSFALLMALIVVLAAFSPVLAEEFKASTAYQARTKALKVFDICAFSAEYPGENSVEGYIIRWDKPIHVCVGGNPTRADRQKLDEFLLELALRVPTLPNITLTQDMSSADIKIYFVPLKQLPKYVPGYVEGNWGMFHYNYNNWRISEAYIGIATDVTDQRSRNHLLQEELVGALGLANDHLLYSDSILYQNWTTVQKLSELDWLMLNMLYSPLVTPGMDNAKVHSVLMQAWSK